MTDPATLSPASTPGPARPRTANDYAAAAARRRRWFLLGGFALSLAAGGAFVAFGLDNIVLPLTLLLCLLTPVLLWNFPRLSLYVTLAAVCLFEMFPTDYHDALTDKVPFFWNINTIFQIYAHANFKGVPLNLLEILILTAGVCSLLRAVFSGTVRLRAGALFVPMAVYMGFVALGWGNGLATGGDFKISLQEVRGQFYFLLAYLMAVNLVQEKRQVGAMLWITVLCVGLKGILYTFRRYVTLAGQPLPDQGVGSHEEAFFFDAFVVLLVVLALCGVHKKLQWAMWALLPFVLTGNLATNRRAATAAMVVIVPVLLLAAYRALPQRRRLAAGLGLALIAGFALYYPAFKNSDSLFAQPARAIRSNFQPDARDASSNAARDAENANLMATVRSAPLRGIGYGKRYLHVVPMADISSIYELEDYLPHNQVLWVWERLGSFGFLAFWMMIAAVLVRAGQTAQDVGADADTKAVALFTLVATGMLMVFGLLDLQMSNFRDMLFTGFWIGALAVAPGLTDGKDARHAR
ncbi:MAG: O-antigen ligase family protein [Armatimonadetes bacterium]|nr:O-antigen ligase family protein [Armatimonadota bacterium]